MTNINTLPGWIPKGRCRECRQSSELCLCDAIPGVSTLSRFLIMRHAREAWKTSNTARLALLALPNSELYTYGAPNAPVPDTGLFARDAHLLFPGSDSETSQLDSVPSQIVVIDGSWNQARRMMYRVPAFRSMPRLTFRATGRARENLRRQHLDNGMSTLEAIACAVRLIDGDTKARCLEALYDLAVERFKQRRRGFGLEDPRGRAFSP